MDQNTISILALVISTISIILSIIGYVKSIIRISIKPYQDECLYFTRMDSHICYGVIACKVKITNRSNTICGINEITLKLGNEIYEAKPYDEIVVTNGEDVKFDNVNTHIPKYMKISSENVFNDLLLNPYETRTVFITFPASIAIPEEIFYGNKKAKLKLIVGNKKFIFKLRIKLISAEFRQEICNLREDKE